MGAFVDASHPAFSIRLTSGIKGVFLHLQQIVGDLLDVFDKRSLWRGRPFPLKDLNCR
jgi:hypothetical protein